MQTYKATSTLFEWIVSVTHYKTKTFKVYSHCNAPHHQSTACTIQFFDTLLKTKTKTKTRALKTQTKTKTRTKENYLNDLFNLLPLKSPGDFQFISNAVSPMREYDCLWISINNECLFQMWWNLSTTFSTKNHFTLFKTLTSMFRQTPSVCTTLVAFFWETFTLDYTLLCTYNNMVIVHDQQVYTRFWFLPKSMTLDDHEGPLIHSCLYFRSSPRILIF